MTNQEILEQDPKFFDRADAHIHLSNSQIEGVNHGKVSASMMYATARFNAYVSWSGFDDKAAFAEARDEAMDVSTTRSSGWLYLADRLCGGNDGRSRIG